MGSKHRRNPNMDLHSIWILGFILNLFFLYAVFQIYFQSPVVEIDKAFRANQEPGPIYSRVVFFVCDGLRADTFFSNPSNHPYLTSLLHSDNSVWGISDTRVPTESRPGHIALFAGIYEDPSAIFTGWKKNFVEFDSVFNRSRYSIALGSPDIVDMFGEGAGREKIHYESYPQSWQDFARNDSKKLDTWVLDRFKRLASNRSIPRHDELLIFLHFLGVDNTGHSYKPTSNEYLKTIQGVDTIMLEVVEIIKQFYEDDHRTLFIFTSDHGMTDWGSHGAGSVAETETPFVIWGKGIKSSSLQMRLKQADFTALVAGALGIEFPTNSIGRFPPRIWTDTQFSYRAVTANFKQLRELFFGKKVIADCGKLPLIPFSGEEKIQGLLEVAEKLAKNENYGDAILTVEQAIDTVLEGIVYYERYNQLVLKCLTVYIFILWILIIAIKVFSPGSQGLHLLCWINSLDLGISVLLTFVILKWPAMLLPYIFFPIYLTRLLISVGRDHGPFAWNYYSQHQCNLTNWLCVGLLSLGGVEIMVMTFYHREIISVGLLLNSVWCLYGKKLNFVQTLLWMGTAILLAIFPTIPIIELDKIPFFVSLASVLCSMIVLLWVHWFWKATTITDRPETSTLVIIGIQIFQIFVAGVFVHFPEFIITRIFAWLSIPSMFLLPVFLSSEIISMQFLSIFLAIFNPFIYLTLNYEVFFMPSLFAALFVLVKIEITTTTNGNEETEESSWRLFMLRRIPDLKNGFQQEINILKSLRVACFQLCFVYVSFFGIGNIASISSFDPTASRCFVSVFSPFVMMGLLLVKILGPFLLVACAFRLLMTSWKQVEVNFTIVLLLCQVMALHMFLNVTNVGSWLEIGTSISHFVIVQVATLFLFFLFFIANFLISWK